MAQTRDYLSIGEVLVALKPEFPDVTISKIRFLESEGLIDPERTASGYRKFYDRDVERLRTIRRTDLVRPAPSGDLGRQGDIRR
jgi:DNA-binding transcriptional MerR regulator